MKVDIAQLHFTRQEIATYLGHKTGREPAHIDEISVTWLVDGDLTRTLTWYNGFAPTLVEKVLPHPEETTAETALWIDGAPMEAAVADTNRMLAIGLARYYHHKANEVWSRLSKPRVD